MKCQYSTTRTITSTGTRTSNAFIYEAGMWTPGVWTPPRIFNEIILLQIGFISYFFACFYSSHPVQFPSHSRVQTHPTQPKIPSPRLLSHIPLERPSHPATNQVPTPVVCIPPRKGCPERRSKHISCANLQNHWLGSFSNRTIRKSCNAPAPILRPGYVGSATAAC